MESINNERNLRKPKLLNQVRNMIRTMHYSYKTEKAYTHWIRRYIVFHDKRHPQTMGEEEINQFLTYLAVKEKVSISTQNQALSAILFLYKEILKKMLGDFGDIIRAKKSKRIPVVLTHEEVRTLLSHLSGTEWIMAMLLYGSGLRLTTAKYYTPSGRSIQLSGITPDIEVKFIPPAKDEEKESPHYMREKDLKGHMLNDTTDAAEEQKEGKKDETALKVKLLLERDNQVRHAVQLLKTWDIFSNMKPVLPAVAEN